MKTERLSKGQLFRMVLLIFLGIFIVVLRIRKMIHLSMIGETSSLTDWAILAGWSIAVFILIWRLLKNFKQQFSV